MEIISKMILKTKYLNYVLSLSIDNWILFCDRYDGFSLSKSLWNTFFVHRSILDYYFAKEPRSNQKTKNKWFSIAMLCLFVLILIILLEIIPSSPSWPDQRLSYNHSSEKWGYTQPLFRLMSNVNFKQKSASTQIIITASQPQMESSFLRRSRPTSNAKPHQASTM